MPDPDFRIVPKLSLDPMPERPTIFDFFRLRFSRRRPDLPFAPAPHMAQSALRALRSGASEETVLACLLHDVGLAFISQTTGQQILSPFTTDPTIINPDTGLPVAGRCDLVIPPLALGATGRTGSPPKCDFGKLSNSSSFNCSSDALWAFF